MPAQMEANFENRIYFFVVKNKTATEITVEMYGTIYKLEKKGTEWKNTLGNRMNMAQGLINAVVNVVLEADNGQAQ